MRHESHECRDFKAKNRIIKDIKSDLSNHLPNLETTYLQVKHIRFAG